VLLIGEYADRALQEKPFKRRRTAPVQEDRYLPEIQLKFIGARVMNFKGTFRGRKNWLR